MADNSYDVETTPNNTTGITYDGEGDGGNNQAIVTVIMSVGGGTPIQSYDDVYGTTTYTSWAFLAEDAEGSIDVFGKIPTNTVNVTPSSPNTAYPAGTPYVSPNPYVPHVGDAISATGEWSPFDGIPELETLSNIGAISTNNTVPTIQAITIPQVLANPNSTSPQGSKTAHGPQGPIGDVPLDTFTPVSGYFAMISNVTISGASPGMTAFPNTNFSFTITDSSGSNMAMFFWQSSYSCDWALAGSNIPSGPVDVYGLADVFWVTTKSGSTVISNASDEFIPYSFQTLVPEPSSYMLAGVGLLSLVAVMRRRRS